MLKQRKYQLVVSLFKMRFFITLSFTAYQLHTMQKITFMRLEHFQGNVYVHKYRLHTVYNVMNSIKTSYFHTNKNKLSHIKQSYVAFCVIQLNQLKH